MDFFKIESKYVKSVNTTIIKPNFIVSESKDLLIKGGEFYAIWNEETGLWSTNSDDAVRLIDNELTEYAEKFKNSPDNRSYVQVQYMKYYDSRIWSTFRKYMKEYCNSSKILDSKIVFNNTPVKKSDYVSKKLPYDLIEGPIDAYEELMSTLYDPEERDKLEWAIGAIISGDTKTIQKFMVLYGGSGTGKSTILNIISDMFEGYVCDRLDAKSLARSSDNFATEQLSTNPLILIQHDGDLSHIEDNTKLNSIVSHEPIKINAKFKNEWTLKPQSFIFMGTNKPVQITDAKSGLLRRLIDVHPSGRLVPVKRYDQLMEQIKFEYGAIAYHCYNKYLSMGKSYYNTYKPLLMQNKTDYFFNFVFDNHVYFASEDEITLKAAYEMYKMYNDDNNSKFVLPKMKFKDEFENYWDECKSDGRNKEGQLVSNLFRGFKIELMGIKDKTDKPDKPDIPAGSNASDGLEDFVETINNMKPEPWLTFISPEESKSIFDELYSDCPAQYATKNDTPSKKWENVTTTLKDIDPTKMHYVQTPDNLIVIDFDIKNENGEKDYQKNLEAASKWPKTYAELSKSEAGIHLHYIYDGDVSKLSRVYDDNIEIKVYTGNSALRRKLTKFNNVEIAHINSGLPLKEENKMVNFEGVKNVKSIRTLIKRNLNKEYHAGTKPSIDFIDKILNDAYNSGMHYDITDLRPSVLYFATKSTHWADYCISKVNAMKFKSDDVDDYVEATNDTVVFYDVEVFPNLFVVVWKPDGKECIKWINPTSAQIEKLIQYKLIGFNNRRYDNHILYARLMGYTNEQLYELSQRIVTGSKNAMFSQAYNLSYSDIYDFASGPHKQSLKKFEIELNIHHQELGLPWDQPVPEDLWEKVADYCINDVVATEATYHYLKSDWLARQILADVASMSVNDTTNTLTTRIIFGNEKKPQSEFRYRNLAEPVYELSKSEMEFLKKKFPDMMSQTHGEAKSLLPYFPGYKFDNGVSTYKGFEVGEGGFVYSEPGMYSNVALIDVASMHPHSALAEILFGVRFTERFYQLVYGRVDIKHEDWDEINDILDGKLVKYVDKVKSGEITSKDLADALKTAINSVYGLTSASFENPFRDPRNIDNIVAKRGALFMIDLKEEVEKRGFTVAHIKTDSIKIPNATPEIIQFVMEFGKKYGYFFEHEATYSKMCLVNKAVYIAKYKDPEKCKELYGYSPSDNTKAAKKNAFWTATGAQFAVPYVFKTLFSHEGIIFRDLCETKNATTSIYLDMNENLPEGEHDYRFVGKTGLFCPIKPGCNGGLLVAQREDKKNGGFKYDSVTGAKDYRWLESEIVENMHREKDIDKSYYTDLVDKAVEEISKYGDFEWLIDETEVELVKNDIPKIDAQNDEMSDYYLPFN